MTIKFGTDGWRAVISETFTFDNLRLVSQAIADFVQEENDSNPSVVIGFDTRFLSDRYAAEVARVMAANGITDARKMGIGKVLVIPQGGSIPVSQPVSTTQQLEQRSDPTTTPLEPVISEPSADDPMSILEALEDEDIPFAEVEVIEGGSQPPGN